MIGERLKELREEKGIKQTDLADMLQVKRQTISSYETDASEPSHETLVKIADIFQVSTDYLLGRTKERENLHYIPNKKLLLEIASILNKYTIKKKD